jgi:hypothetical protein
MTDQVLGGGGALVEAAIEAAISELRGEIEAFRRVYVDDQPTLAAMLSAVKALRAAQRYIAGHRVGDVA